MRDWFVTRYPEHLWQLAVRLVVFGDSALRFLAGFHIDAFRERIAVADATYRRVAIAFAAAGIEIPFHQRGVHIRSGGAPLRV